MNNPGLYCCHLNMLTHILKIQIQFLLYLFDRIQNCYYLILFHLLFKLKSGLVIVCYWINLLLFMMSLNYLIIGYSTDLLLFKMLFDYFTSSFSSFIYFLVFPVWTILKSFLNFQDYNFLCNLKVIFMYPIMILMFNLNQFNHSMSN